MRGPTQRSPVAARRSLVHVEGAPCPGWVWKPACSSGAPSPGRYMGNGCSSAQMSECEKALERGRENHWCSLAGKGLKCVPPPAMEASTLLRLDLSRNMLRELPHTLGKLVNLQALFLRENRLVSLPEEIGLCVALEEIHADSNRLTALPDSVGDLFALRVLRLRDNLLHTVPNTLGRCHRLRVLDVRALPCLLLLFV